MKEIDAPLSKVSEAVLWTAHRLAAQYKTSCVGTDALLLSLVYSPGTAARRLLTDAFNLTEQQVLSSTLQELPLDSQFKKEIFRNGLLPAPTPTNDFDPTPRLRQVIERACGLMDKDHETSIFTDILLRALCDTGKGVGPNSLRELGIDLQELAKRASESNFLDSYIDKSSGMESQIIITLNESKLAVGHRAPLGLYRIPLASGDFVILKPGRSSIKGFFTQNQIQELEELINNPKTDENDLQKYFEQNPEFLKMHKHSQIYPQIQLTGDEGNVLIPDFFLRGAKDNLDICDIKLPSVKITAGSRNRRRFSASVLEGVAQLRNYRNYFDDTAKRKQFCATHGLTCYKPRLYLVIGRSKDFNSYIERRDCELDFSDVDVLTYDDLLKVANEQILSEC
jgi:hypothetical protein